MIEPLAQIPFETKLLKLIKVGVMHRAALPLVKGADIDVVAHQIADTLAIKMEAHVLTDQVLTDERDVYVEGYADVTTQKLVRRWRWLPGVYRKVEVSQQVPVHGSAKVRADYFVSFPHVDRSMYPGDFGRPVKLMQLSGTVNWADGES